MPEIWIRDASLEDADAIAQVLYDSFAQYESFYTREGFAATTPNPDQIRTRMHEGPVWVAIRDHIAVGTVAAVAQGKSLYMRGMAVLPLARESKLGTQLLQQVEAWGSNQGCHRVLLSTTPFLLAAIHLYESAGFQRIDEGPHELFGTPLFTMEKNL